MKLIKVQAKKTYVGKDGKEHHYYNYFVEMANGKRIQIKCAYAERGWFAIGYKVIKAKVNTISYEGMKSFAISHKMTISQLIRSAIYRYMKATREEEKIKDFLNNL